MHFDVKDIKTLKLLIDVTPLKIVANFVYISFFSLYSSLLTPPTTPPILPSLLSSLVFFLLGRNHCKRKRKTKRKRKRILFILIFKKIGVYKLYLKSFGRMKGLEKRGVYNSGRKKQRLLILCRREEKI